MANPLRGLTSDTAYIRSALETIDGPVVLVRALLRRRGHHRGRRGGLPNIEALVYVAALRPGRG